MNALHSLEHTIASWIKNVPHLPSSTRRLIGENLWWVVFICVVVEVVGLLYTSLSVSTQLSFIDTSTAVLPAYLTPWGVVVQVVALVFGVLGTLCAALAIQPLRRQVKKGWVLLFATWLIYGLWIAVNALLTLNIVSFIVSVLFQGIFAALFGYLLFEVHGQFAHETKAARKASK